MKYEFDARRYCQTNMDRMGVMPTGQHVGALIIGEINALRTENDALRQESEFYRKQCDMRDEWRDKLEARVARLEEALKRGIELHENCDADTCMCGASMWHPLHDHKPTAMLQYYGDQWVEEARRALEEK